MATNAIGPDTENIPLNLPKEMIPKLDFLAKRSGVSRNAYIAGVLIDAAKTGRLVRRTTEVYCDPEVAKELTEVATGASATGTGNLAAQVVSGHVRAVKASQKKPIQSS